MRNISLLSALSTIGVALMVSSCATEDASAEDEEATPADVETEATANESAEVAADDGYKVDLSQREPNENVPAELLGENSSYIMNPEQVSIPLSGETADHSAYMDVPVEVFPQCDDQEALASNEGHVSLPAGPRNGTGMA